MDYYGILEISREATSEQIQNGFKRLSHKFNPVKAPTNQAVHAEKFGWICEAYEVLSDAKKKGIFDKYGEYGLKNGVTDEFGNRFEGYTFLGNSEEIHDKYFDTKTPMQETFELDGQDIYGSLLGDGFQAKNQLKPAAPKDIELTLNCSLQEFYNGSMKTLNYNRNQIYPDGRTVNSVEEQLKVEIKPGYDDKTVLIISGQGHEQFQHPRGNLKIKCCLDSSLCPSNYVRKGNDLIYTHCITLQDSLTSCPIKLITLDNRVININMDQIITPQTVHCVSGEGMPISQGTAPEEILNHLKPIQTLPRGDLYIRFDIQFPTNISIEQKNKVVELLRQNAAQFVEQDSD